MLYNATSKKESHATPSQKHGPFQSHSHCHTKLIRSKNKLTVLKYNGEDDFSCTSMLSHPSGTTMDVLERTFDLVGFCQRSVGPTRAMMNSGNEWNEIN